MANASGERPRAGAGGKSRLIARLSTETKQAFKTTEFYAFVAAVVGILIAAAVVGGDDKNANGNGGDHFGARAAWLYVAIVTVGYMVSRGLAKSGSREPYWADEEDLPGGEDRS